MIHDDSHRGSNAPDLRGAPFESGTTLNLTLLYGLLATIWVLGSDAAMVRLTPELTQLAWIGTAKGLGFVGVTTALLYAVLARERAAQAQLDSARQATEARYKRLAENAPDIIYHYRLAPEPGFEYVSAAAAGITGYEPAEYYADPQLGRALVWPDGQGQAWGEGPQIVRWVRRDGRVVWIERRSVAIRDAAGALVAIEGVARDVTERQESAAHLRLLETALSATASAVVITDRDGVIQWVNGAFTTLTGYPRAEAIGQNPRLLRSGQQPESFYTEMWDTVLSGSVWRGEMVNRRKDGSLYHEEQTITPVRSDGDTISHFIGIKQDVSTRVAREREQRVLATLATALRAATTREQLPLTLLRELAALLQIDGAALALCEPASGTAKVEAAVGALAPLAGGRLTTGANRECCAGKRTQIASEEIAPALFDAARAAGGAGLCTPLRIDDEVIGALWTVHGAAPDEAEQRLLQQVADMAASAIHRAALHEQTARRLQRLISLHAIDQTIAASLDIDRTLATALDQVLTRLGVDAAAVLLMDDQGRQLRYRAGAGFQGHRVTETQIALGEGLLGEAVQARRPIRLPVIPVSGDTFTRGTLLHAEGFVAYYALPLIAKGQVKGVLELFHRAPLARDAEWQAFLETLAGHIALAIDYAELVEHLRRANDELAQAYDQTLEGWARALELRDRETEGHSRRVTAMTERLAAALGVPDEQRVHIRRGALLHDIGKLGVPDAILQKPGPLTADEWALMREHPDHAYRLLSPISYLRPALEIPYAHHERWDGSGYPRGLVGEEIPLAARIFAVVDVWDALTTQRPYKPAWSREQAGQYLREQAGAQFDPAVVAAFGEILSRADEPPEYELLGV